MSSPVQVLSPASPAGAQIMDLHPPRKKDVSLEQRLFATLFLGGIADDGSFNTDPVLRAVLLHPIDTAFFAGHLAAAFSHRQIQAVIGFEAPGYALAQSVANALTFSSSDEAGVAALFMERHGTQYEFPGFLNARHELRGKHLLFVKPVLTPECCPMIQGCVEAVNQLAVNASLVSVAGLFQIGELSVKSSLQVTALKRLI